MERWSQQLCPPIASAGPACIRLMVHHNRVAAALVALPDMCVVTFVVIRPIKSSHFGQVRSYLLNAQRLCRAHWVRQRSQAIQNG